MRREQCCENCRFWISGDDREGSCRRMPPVPMEPSLRHGYDKGEHYEYIHPRTDSGDWCGEWKEEK